MRRGKKEPYRCLVEWVRSAIEKGAVKGKADTWSRLSLPHSSAWNTTAVTVPFPISSLLVTNWENKSQNGLF